MGKAILTNQEGRARLLNGAKTVFDVVKTTLGAKGNNVVIQEPNGFPYVTKDGINTLRKITLTDPVENMGAQIIRQASEMTSKEAGDATTTTAILAYSMLEKGMELLDIGHARVDIIKSMEKAGAEIDKEISKMAIPITDKKNLLYQVSVVSTNNDEVLGGMIAELMEQLGTSGIVVVEDSVTGSTYYEKSSGMKIEKGWAHPAMINNHYKGLMEYDKPIIMVTEEEVMRLDQIKPFVEHCIRSKRPGIIICSDIGGEALGTLNYNISQQIVKMGVIVAPSHGGILRDIMEDIAIYVGANLISDRVMKSTSQLDINDLGEVDKIKSSYSGSLFINNVDTERYHTRIAELTTFIEETEDSGIREIAKKRLANMTGKTAIIYAWADTPSELIELKDRIDDAVNATKSAMKEGIVPGGGVCLANIARKRWNHPRYASDEVLDMVYDTLTIPMQIIFENAGLEFDSGFNEIRGEKEGINVLTEKSCNMIKEGIIDPAKSIRVSVKNAISAVKTILRTDAVIYEESKN